MIENPGSVTEQTLIKLLEEGAEDYWLDYKRTLDLTEKRDRVELAKDIGAMQAHGGYVVIGADDHGRPAEQFTLKHRELLDEARLRKILKKWIPEPFELRSVVHELDGHMYALIYTGPRNDGCCIFQAKGSYEGPDGKEEVIFREGEIFVRHGTSSERAHQFDLERIRRGERPEPVSVADDVPIVAMAPPPDAMNGPDRQDSRRIIDAIRQVLEAEFDVSADHIDPDTSLEANLGLSRPELLELIMAVEDTLGLDLPDETFVGKRFATVADLTVLFGAALGDVMAGRPAPA